MEISLNDDQWGYVIDEQFLKDPINDGDEVMHSSLLVLKESTYVQDIDRTVVTTDYYEVVEDRLIHHDKREFTKILGERMFTYMKENNQMPFDCSIGKESKNITKVEFSPDEYDTFYVKIRREFLDGDDPSVWVRRLNEPPEKPKRKSKSRDTKNVDVIETFKVDGSKNNTYTVRKKSDNSWTCSCPHFGFRLSKSGGECKHIKHVK